MNKRLKTPQFLKKFTSSFDDLFIATFFILVALGLVTVFSASSMLSLKNVGHSYHYLLRQSLFVLIGTAAFFTFQSISFQTYKKWAPFLLIGCLILIIMVLIPGIGVKRGGATRWFSFFGFGFQPSEFLKLSVILFLSSSLSTKTPKELKSFKKGFLPYSLIILFCMGLVLLQRDFGSAMTIAFCSIILFFLAGIRFKYLFYSVITLITMSVPLIFFTPYRMNRILAFLDPWENFKHKGFQIIQSFVSFQSGGLWGQGIGGGKQKLFYLPAGHTDFIFAVLAEEAGFIGSSLAILAFFFIFWKGLNLARKNNNDPFAFLLSSGIIILFTGNVIINLGVVMGLLPTKGLTLPLFSYGGSSLLMYMVAFGILMNVFMQKKSSTTNEKT